MNREQLEALEYTLSPDYCVRCDSTVGGGNKEYHEGFCTLCWKNRKPLPLRLRRLLKAMKEELS